MISMPVFTPCRYLQRPQPPNVLAGIDAFRCSRPQVQQAVDEALEVQAIGHAESTDSEESGPTEKEITER